MSTFKELMKRLTQPAKPTFSVIIPAFNEERLLPECLKSLSQQIFKDFEVIVIDNNSTDKTAAIAAAYGARVVEEIHPGVCWARQAGLKAAKGKIIVSTDADTTYPDSWLKNINNKFQVTGVVAVGGPVIYGDDIWWANVWSKCLFGFSALCAKLFGQPIYVSACNLAFRKSAIKGYETNLTQGGDELAVLKQLKTHGRVVIDRKNNVFTSGRRQSRGLLYTFFVTLVWYYLLGYILSKLTKRTVFGGYPAFRDISKHAKAPLLVKFAQRASLFAVLAVLVIIFRVHPARAARAIQKVPHNINNYIHDKE